MFEKFTDQARHVVVLAQEEARVHKDDHLGTEHILLGLLLETEGTAAKALESLGVSPEAVRAQLPVIAGKGRGHSKSIPFTPRARATLEFSLSESMRLGHNYIDTEHILLGLIRGGEGVAIEVLDRLGAEPNRVRQKLMRLLAGYQDDGPDEA